MTELLDYDEERLLEQLSALPATRRAIFALSCAERLFPAYRWFHDTTSQGDPTALRRVLDAGWGYLYEPGRNDVTSHQVVAESLVPYEDESWVEESAIAENAAAAVTYAIGCLLTGDAQQAVWAARQPYELLDWWTSVRQGLDWTTPEAKARILADSSIQAELVCQERDLEELAENSSLDLDRFRLRAQAEGLQGIAP